MTREIRFLSLGHGCPSLATAHNATGSEKPFPVLEIEIECVDPLPDGCYVPSIAAHSVKIIQVHGLQPKPPVVKYKYIPVYSNGSMGTTAYSTLEELKMAVTAPFAAFKRIYRDNKFAGAEYVPLCKEAEF